MTETQSQIRLATTAMIAVLAISSTPLLAQDAAPPDTSVETPITPATDPLAPAPATDTTATPEPTVAPEAAPATSESKRERTTTTTTRRRAATAAPAPSRPVEAPAADQAPPVTAEAAVPPVAAPPAPEAIAPVAPVRVEPAESRLRLMNTILPIGAAAVLGLLAMLIAAMMLRRRRRRREALYEQEAYAAAQYPSETVEPEPEPSLAPTLAAAPVATTVPRHDPVPSASATPLPEGFDLSRFGRHVQAAYRGPTPENPSLSLKHRLRKASAMDQRERVAGTEIAEPARPAPAETTATVTAKPQPAPASGGFMLGGNEGTKATVRRAYSE